MQQYCVEIVDALRVLDGCPADCIGATCNLATFNATTSILLGPEVGQDGCTCFHSVAELSVDRETRFFWQDQFGSRPEFDHAELLTPLQIITRLEPADNTPGNRTGDLTNYDSTMMAVIGFYHDCELLILSRRFGTQCIEVFA